MGVRVVDRRRFVIAMGVICSLLALLTVGILSLLRDDGQSVVSSASSAPTTPAPTTPPTTPPPPTTAPPPTAPPDGKNAAQRTLTKVTTITDGPLRPKSVVYSGNGLFFAQNMMYAHTMTVYNRKHELVKVIPDTVTLSDFGFPEYTGQYQGAPVEAAFTHDGSHAYVSQYQMYGTGFDNPGDDSCPGSGNDDSFVYRVSTSALTIDQVIKVGAVPKYVAVTPDDRLVLVTNWCTYDMSVIDVASGKEIKRIPIGRFPRGIAVTTDSKFAYVAVMGGSKIGRVDLATFAVTWIEDVGDGPRHLVLSPDDKWLYVTLNADGAVAKIALPSGEVVARKSTGTNPRSMVLSDDGTAMYVVNYGEDTISKVRTEDLGEIQKLESNHHPIGITYDPVGREVWVASYAGSLMVFRDG